MHESLLCTTPPPLSSASFLVQALLTMGIESWMITGDGAGAAASVAAQVGIPPSRVMAQVLPAGKGRKVQELQRTGRVVAMVGDGINDAPALAQVPVSMQGLGGEELARGRVGCPWE